MFSRSYAPLPSPLLPLATAIVMACSVPPAAKADLIADWGHIVGEAIKDDNANYPERRGPTYASRAYAMVNAAMFDAANATEGNFHSYSYTGAVNLNASGAAAAAQSAHDVLVSLYPSQAARFDTQLATSLATVSDPVARSLGQSLGTQAAGDMILKRQNDGATTLYNYVVNPDPGHYQPTGPNPYPNNPGQPLGMGWGQVTPFTLQSATQFTVPGPPALNSQAYADSFNQVKSVGSLNSTTRTADQTEIAKFWAYDRGGLGPPPILYDEVVSRVAAVAGLTLVDSARLHALSALAQGDAGVAAWGVKYAVDLWRPVTAIRAGATDGNAATLGDPTWTPLGAPGPNDGSTADDFTPPFPAYVSGHATFGGATFQVLRDYFKSDAFTFTLESGELPGLTRDYTTFSQAEWENSISRVYLGVHWDFDSIDGQRLGNEIGSYVFANALTAVPEPSSAVLALAVGACWFPRRRSGGLAIEPHKEL